MNRLLLYIIIIFISYTSTIKAQNVEVGAAQLQEYLPLIKNRKVGYRSQSNLHH
jgi:hypothetical protein